MENNETLPSTNNFVHVSHDNLPSTATPMHKLDLVEGRTKDNKTSPSAGFVRCDVEKRNVSCSACNCLRDVYINYMLNQSQKQKIREKAAVYSGRTILEIAENEDITISFNDMAGFNKKPS
jgi:hypothetical protein